MITDSTQTPVATYRYDSFGTMTQTGTLSQPYTYTGREWDKETGLYYYRARYYDPMVGRFISKDPIGFAGGGVNLYGYVSNNPVNWVDPLGLTANCPPHEDGIVSNNGFVRYGSNSIRRFFEKKYHCGFHCYLENRNEYCPKDPGAECCYDESKLLVTKGHRYAGCMGSNDDYRCNSISGCWNHNYNDSGGPNSSWGPLGESTSKRYNRDHQRQLTLPYIEPMAP
jgi:RHS repeat-associated protein